MKLGEKLQRLRRQSGLSQEQLAAQLTVSRQAVSKWELDDAMPDTENVVQLSRIFGVSCDYLLRDEVEEPDITQPAPPGETHLTEQGWARSATVLSLAVCAVGLLLALGGWLHSQTSGPLIIGLIVQISGVMLFELAAPRMGERRVAARLKFYMAACWLILPIPVSGLCWWLDFYIRPIPRLYWDVASLSCYLLLGVAVTAVLFLLRWRQAHKK